MKLNLNISFKFVNFFESKDVEDFEEDIEQAAKKIKSNANWFKDGVKQIAEWIKTANNITGLLK